MINKPATHMANEEVKTPCIGVCSTGIGDSVCRGCKRYAHEIIGWNGFSCTEQKAVVKRLNALLSQVVQQRLRIVDVTLLYQQVNRHQVRITNTFADEYCVAYEALRHFGNQLPSLAEIGCAARLGHSYRSLSELKNTIDEAFFDLSCAHYERYFPGAL